MEEVLKNIRSVIVSSKGKFDLRTLQHDYRMLMGEDIPYRKFGYPSLELFLKQFSTLNVTAAINGQVYVDAVKTSNVSHLVDFVNRQKNPKKKQTRAYFKPHNPVRATVPNPNWKPATKGKKWEMSYQPSPRPTLLSHNQIVNWNPKGAAGEAAVSPTSSTSPSSPPAQMTPPLLQQSDKKLARPKGKAMPSPRSRAAAASKIQNTPEQDTDVAAVSVPHLPRSSSSGALPGLESAMGRPRMRTQTSMPGAAAATSPTCAMPLQFGAPQLSPAQLEQQLRREVVRATPTPQQSSPSPDESSQRGSGSSGDADTDSAWARLHALARRHALAEPTATTCARHSRSLRLTLYDCQVRVGGSAYSSYPQDCHSEEAAREAAAGAALAQLGPQLGRPGPGPLLLSSERDVLLRIPPIVQSHFHGVWSTQIELDYEDRYRERLPPDWLVLLDTLDTISVEPALHGRMVLRHCRPGDKHKAGGARAPDVSVPSNTVQLSERGCYVQVTCALSTVEVWCRQLDTPAAARFEEMMRALDAHYRAGAGCGQRAATVAVGGFYAACVDDAWCRVRTLQAPDRDAVLCFLIDCGDESTVPRTHLYELSREFAREQAQAFVCRLAGLEELADLESAARHVQRLAAASYLAVPLRGDEPDQCPRVVLYDGDTNVNRQLIGDITRDSVRTQLDPAAINKVYVTHAEPSGLVYVQVHSEGVDKFHELMAHLNAVGVDADEPTDKAAARTQALAAAARPDQLYLTRWANDGKYYRCSVLDVAPSADYAQVFFVDYGNTDIVRLRDARLVPLHLVSDAVCQFPPQAVRVRLHLDVPLPTNFVDRVLDIMPADQLVLLKVVRAAAEDGAPACVFYKRSEAGNALFSVNKSLQIEAEMSDKLRDADGVHDDGNNNQQQQRDRAAQLSQKLERLSTFSRLVDAAGPVPSHGLLRPPALPPVGSFFDVHVSCAVSPWNFFVQPYESRKQLQDMMVRLQLHQARARPAPVPMGEVLPGRIYASQYSDGSWYRTSVIKVIHSGSISVFYVDFGYYGNLRLNELVPLAADFMQLPYQAIKAKMAAIHIRDKWTTEDCAYFQQLVCRKDFVSQIMDVDTDELHRSDTVLSLQLIDTSASTDVYLHRVLIERGVAAADTPAPDPPSESAQPA